MNKRIYIKDWLELKPYDTLTTTDAYYLNLSNKVKNVILSHQESHDLREAYNENDFNHLACFLTAYFEDLISETNIWNSFIRLHKRLYDKPLPFFNTEAYFEEEINIQDISFLIWYFLNAIQEETFINPYNLFLTEFADLVIKIFDEEWEYAPENKVLKTFYQIDEKVDDYHIARIKIDNVLFKSYLFFPDTTLKLSNLELKILEKYRHNKDLNVFLFDSRDDLLNKIHTQLLSLTGKEWLAEIIGINHPLSAEFLKMSEKLKGNFLYKGQDDENIMVEHIASGRAFKVVKKSFSTYESLKKIDTIIYMGIIRWKEEWWFSGVQAQMLYDATLVLEEKNSLASKSAVNFLNNEPKKVKEVLEKQLKAFIAFNNGSPIAFMPSNKIEGFFKSYIEYYNKSLNFTVEEYEEHKNKMNKDEISNFENKTNKFSEYSENGLAFFNPNGGVVANFGFNSAFPLPTNPYFKEEESDEDTWQLIIDDSTSTELVMYCIDNCKDKLSFFNKGLGKFYLKDIDFLLRYFKGANYYTTPEITLTGQEE